MNPAVISAVAVAIITTIGNICVSYLSHKKSQAIFEYRLDELEHKVDKHNNLIERTYNLEKSLELLEEKVELLHH